jgi:hypothetical protein
MSVGKDVAIGLRNDELCHFLSGGHTRQGALYLTVESVFTELFFSSAADYGGDERQHQADGERLLKGFVFHVFLW